MSQYNIQPDPKLPDDEEIRASMNFNAVYDRYAASHQRHWWQRLRLRPRLFAGVTLVFAVCLLVYEAVQEEEQAEKTAKRAERLLDQAQAEAATRDTVWRIISKDTHFIRVSPPGGNFSIEFKHPDSQVFKVNFYDRDRKIWVEKGLLRPKVVVHKIFKLDVLSSEFPELDSIKDLHWQQFYGPDVDSLLRLTWDAVVVERRNNGLFAIFLEKGAHTELIGARPVSGQSQGDLQEYLYPFIAERAGIYQLVPQRPGK